MEALNLWGGFYLAVLLSHYEADVDNEVSPLSITHSGFSSLNQISLN